GGGTSRVFQVDANVIVSISGLTITGGTAANGGGLANYGAATLSNCTITRNFSTASSLDTSAGGAGPFRYRPHTLFHRNISTNTAAGEGGGLFERLSTMTLSDCIISGNSANAGEGGGVYCYGGTTTLTDCTVSGNSAHISGGGLNNRYGNLTLANCTVSGN